MGSMDRGWVTAANGIERVQPQAKDNIGSTNRCSFHMPLHYPRYTGADYESMPEWMLNRLLSDYGILIDAEGDVDSKRRFAMGTFFWPAAHRHISDFSRLSHIIGREFNRIPIDKRKDGA